MSMLIEPACPFYVKEFFEFLQSHITLQSTGMGVGIRESRIGLAQLMLNCGWEYVIYRPLVEAYEDALLESHYKLREEPK